MKREPHAVLLVILSVAACQSATDGEPRFASLVIESPRAGVVAGRSMQLTATGRNPYGGVVPVGAVSWHLEATPHATLSTGGLLAGLTPGEVIVTAVSRGVSTSRTIYVKSTDSLYADAFERFPICSYVDFWNVERADITDGQIEFVNDSVLFISANAYEEPTDTTWDILGGEVWTAPFPLRYRYVRSAAGTYDEVRLTGFPGDTVRVYGPDSLIRLYGTDSVVAPDALWGCSVPANPLELIYAPKRIIIGS